ncbi:MAG: TIGR01777 family oxidoreductase [Streptosporangiaceae bacterium]|jgi:uncharacterized protein (TIGR01777 family)
MRVVVTGSAGLIGTALTESLRQGGAEVVRLVRGQPASPAEIRWDPLAPRGGLDPAVLSGADAVVHLAGAPIASGRWTEARKHELRASRVTSTEGLVAAMTAAAVPPLVLLAGSAIGWYGDTGDREVDESAPAGTGFLAALVRDWEAAAAAAGAAGVRVVNLRSGIVLSRRGGMLARLAPVFRLGLGARLGAGDQYISWISLTDEVRAIRFLQDQAGISGPVNLTAPEPVTNAELTAALASAVGRPALLRVPAGLLRAGLGEVSSELLAGARVRPARLRQAGFEFRHPELRAALGAELAASR